MNDVFRILGDGFLVVYATVGILALVALVIMIVVAAVTGGWLRWLISGVVTVIAASGLIGYLMNRH